MFKKILISYWFVQSYIKKYSLYILIGIILSVAGSFAIFQVFKNVVFIRSLKVGIIGNYTRDSIPMEVLQKISRGLTKENNHGSYEPDLAKSISIKNDGLLYEITLKNDIFWDNGTKFTTSDINYNFKDVKFVAKDEKTGYFILKNPYAPFLQLLSIPITNANLSGLGNYHVEKIEWDGEFIKSIFLTGPAHVVYRFYPNEKIAFTAFQLGEVNRLEDLTHLEDFKIWRKVKINKEADANRFAAIFFNFKGDFVTNEKSFRQALAYATNKSPFAEKKAYSSFSFKSPFYSDAVKKYFYDEETARNLLNKVTGDNKTKAKKINFTLYSAPEYETYAKNIVNNWNRVLGTSIKVRVSNGIPYTWQAYLVTSEIPTDPDQYSLWHSSKTFYFSSYRNLKVDKLLEDGRNEIETTKRKENYNELQKTLTEELPAIFLFYPWKYTISY